MIVIKEEHEREEENYTAVRTGLSGRDSSEGEERFGGSLRLVGTKSDEEGICEARKKMCCKTKAGKREDSWQGKWR